MVVMQSDGLLHLDPSLHRLAGRHVPPQSASVSAAFLIPSLQVGTTIYQLRYLTLQVSILTLANI